jgi:hypothetical protein
MIRSSQTMLRASAAAAIVALTSTLVLAQTKQEHVHEMGQTVMPFDLARTTHIFKMTDTGGVQSQARAVIGPVSVNQNREGG